MPRHIENNVTPKYIDLKKALDNICKNGITWFHDDETLVSLSNVLNILYNTEDADVVEVVRCKDCRWHEVYCQNIVGGWCNENWFCADGERRTNAEIH